MAVNPVEIIQLGFMVVWRKLIDRGTGIFWESDVRAAGL